ncbi:MAG: hypothetical protein QXW94_00010 [Desulfurococcaceae archaeon]
MKQYGVSVFKMYYRGLVNPFKCETYSVLLSCHGEDRLKGFLRKMIEVNRDTMISQDMRRLETLVEELKTSINLLRPGSYYVIYRRNRAFTACIPEDLSMAISSHNISYIECRSLEQAYYYMAVLNYLAFKVVKSGRSFIRDQFARPALAVVVAGLSWRVVPEEIRREISALAEQLSRKLVWREYSNQKVALKEVAQTSEFNRIISVLDGYVDREKLNSALELVSATGATEEESGETEE